MRPIPLHFPRHLAVAAGVQSRRRRSLGRIGRFGVFPVLVYFTTFCLLTWPLIGVFGTHLFADQGDGYQNLWSLWWVGTAVRDLGV